MALRKIVFDGDPLLQKQSREVAEITPRIRTLIEDMWETLYASNGVGLAAPQVGVLRRVVVIDATPPPDDETADENTDEASDAADAGEDDDANTDAGDSAGEGADLPEEAEEAPAPPLPQKYTLINPEIVWASEETLRSKEGCLSVPGCIATVTRAEKVRVKALDEEGQPIEIETDGLLAKALQHEIDHLNGIIILDIADEIEEVGKDTSE